MIEKYYEARDPWSVTVDDPDPFGNTYDVRITSGGFEGELDNHVTVHNIRVPSKLTGEQEDTAENYLLRDSGVYQYRQSIRNAGAEMIKRSYHLSDDDQLTYLQINPKTSKDWAGVMQGLRMNRSALERDMSVDCLGMMAGQEEMLSGKRKAPPKMIYLFDKVKCESGIHVRDGGAVIDVNPGAPHAVAIGKTGVREGTHSWQVIIENGGANKRSTSVWCGICRDVSG